MAWFQIGVCTEFTEKTDELRKLELFENARFSEIIIVGFLLIII